MRSSLRLSSGSNNCALGNRSLYNTSSGSNNTSIGFNSFNTNAYPGGSTISNSTAIGYNSNPFASNQIMLGTINETVYCPNKLNINGTDMSNIFLSYNNYTLNSINNNIYYN